MESLWYKSVFPSVFETFHRDIQYDASQLNPCENRDITEKTGYDHGKRYHDMMILATSRRVDRSTQNRAVSRGTGRG